MAVITDVGLWELIKHLKQWLTNLNRANSARQRRSVEALRAVVIAARHTQAYLRLLNDTANQDHKREAALSEMWTELGFKLTDLGLSKLAKRCDIKGRYWADPGCYEDEFLEKADVGLERMEQLARQLLAQVERGKT
ncbi:MAG: hypothetical protein KJP11_00700 [Gammaproteobacteria bacterium]|nr:hypothetical protein [Gammaproteobacteria bacterium]